MSPFGKLKMLQPTGDCRPGRTELSAGTFLGMEVRDVAFYLPPRNMG
jgi:hypothetical protein